MKLILASNSPRRKELLEKYNYKFTVIKSNFDESKIKKHPPKKLVKILAYNKALSVFKDNKDSVVLGADTVVVYKNKILGKPNNKKDAVKTLQLLSGRKHYVYTGFAIISNKKKIVKYVKSKVCFNTLSNDLIKKYVDTGLPLDKAGSYGIQDGFPIVKRYIGSYNNIVGLPIETIDKILIKKGNNL